MKLGLLAALPLFFATAQDEEVIQDIIPVSAFPVRPVCNATMDCGVNPDPCCFYSCDKISGTCFEACASAGPDLEFCTFGNFDEPPKCDPLKCPESAPGCFASCDEDDMCTQECPYKTSACNVTADCGVNPDPCCFFECHKETNTCFEACASPNEDGLCNFGPPETTCDASKCPSPSPGCVPACDKNNKCTEECIYQRPMCNETSDCGVTSDPCCFFSCDKVSRTCFEACASPDEDGLCNFGTPEPPKCDASNCTVSAPGCVASCDENDECAETCPPAMCMNDEDCGVPDDKCCFFSCLEGECALACAEEGLEGCGKALEGCESNGDCPAIDTPGCSAVCKEDGECVAECEPGVCLGDDACEPSEEGCMAHCNKDTNKCEEKCPPEPMCEKDKDCGEASSSCCFFSCLDGECAEACFAATPGTTCGDPPLPVATCKATKDCPRISTPGCSSVCKDDGECGIECEPDMCLTDDACVPSKEECEAECNMKTNKCEETCPPEPMCLESKDCGDLDDECCFFSCLGGQCVRACFAAGPESNCGDPPLSAGTCRSSRECPRDQYCADGMCLDDGTCAIATDCVNPNNDLGDIDKECDGYFKCNSKDKCSKRCRSSGCPVLKPPVQCLVDPCEAKKDECPEAAECVSDFCGGCNAIFFDAAGKRVCKKGNNGSRQKCELSSECGPDQFCGTRGFCLQKGQCTKLGDCKNDDNEIPKNRCKRSRVRIKRKGITVYRRRRLADLSCKRNECTWICRKE